MGTEGSYRQIWTLWFGAMLAPMAALPTAGGGTLGWLGPLIAFPAGAVWLWLCRGLDPAAVRRRPLGGALGTLYYIWAAALGAMTAGRCVDRLCRTDYLGAPRWVLSLAVVGVCAWLVSKGRRAFLRAGEVFFLILTAALGLFLVLGSASISWENLRPRWDGGDVLTGAWAAAGTLAVGALAGVFPHTPRREGESAGWKWLGAWCAAAAALWLAVLGTLGETLTDRGPLPFFLTLQGIGVQGGFQRLEALGTAVWVFSDLGMMGMVALGGESLAGERRWAVWPVLGAAVLGGWLLSDRVLAPLQGVIMGVNVVLGGGMPPVLAWLTRRKNKRR